MKKNIFILLSIILSLASCQEIISLDLNASNSQLVVEGSVTANSPAMVKISKSINFDQKDSFPAISNAVVTLTDNIGNSETLTEKSPGIYIANKIIGMIGRTYALSVKKDDNNITSECKIPNQVKFDSLIIKANPGFGRGSFGGNTTTTGAFYNIRVKFRDPASEKNYYRFTVYKNQLSTGTIHVYDDRLTNGLTNDKTLYEFSTTFSPGDTLKVDMQCIDASVYEYFNSFTNTQMGGSTPANPYTNLTGAVLGYFSAHTAERKSVIIK